MPALKLVKKNNSTSIKTSALISMLVANITVLAPVLLLAKASADPSMLWYGVGLDWKLYNCNPDNPSGTPLNLSDLLQGWQYEITNYLGKYEFNSVRLAFSFEDSGGNHTESILNTTELDAVLDVLSTNHIKAILDLHNWVDKPRNWTEMQGFFGSQAWINGWTTLAAKYKDDSRVLAYEIFNEPSHDLGYWDQNVTSGGCGIQYTGVGKSVQMALAECVDAIRSTGDSHTIVYPDPHYFTDNYTAELHPEWFYNSFNNRPNIRVTFHNWFEDPTQQTATLFQAWWNERTTIQSLWKAYYPVWIGEFGISLAAKNLTMQTYVNKAIANWALNNNVGFNIFVGRSNPTAEEQQLNMTESVLTSFPRVPTITTFTTNPALFSPSLRTTTINASFDIPTNWTLQVVTSANEVLQTWKGSSQDISIVWDGKNSTGHVVPDGAYYIRLSSNTDLYGAAFETSKRALVITIPGDLNGDFKVSLQDLVILANAYGSKFGDANWNPNVDMDGNGIVGLSDLVILAQHYGQHYP